MKTEIEEVMEVLSNLDPATEEYTRAVQNLKTLCEADKVEEGIKLDYAKIEAENHRKHLELELAQLEADNKRKTTTLIICTTVGIELITIFADEIRLIKPALSNGAHKVLALLK